MNQSALISAAHDDVKYVLHVLAVASAGGPRSKPTVAQLNDIVSRLENADKFLRAAKPAKEISDEDIRAILSCKDVASGRAAIDRVLSKSGPDPMLRTKPDTGTAHTPEYSEMARALAEAKANEIYSSQLMRRFRDTLSNVRDGLEDEGDRIYFGSTNDADQLRDIIEEVEELEWDRILASSQKKPDLYARIRELNTEVREARSTQKELLSALKAMRVVMDSGPKPEKLDAALSWRECDEKARAMCDAAISKAEGR